MISSGHNSSNLVWLRLDLRLTENPALAAAVERGGAVIPVFIHAPEENRHGGPAVLPAGGCINHCGSLTPDYANAARG